MVDGEQVLAEQDVSIDDRQTMHVRISRHHVEDFWRVHVDNSATLARSISTTVGAGDSFLMNLIEEAVSGKDSAWLHLARWGHANLTRPAIGFRAALA